MKEPRAGRHLLVASTGGHLAQLNKWSQVIGSADDSLWVTFRSPQSDSMLADRRTLFVPYVAPRDFGGTVRAFVQMMGEIGWAEESFSAAVTTGAALGLAGIAAARLHGIPSFYFESVSRIDGPSLTGRLASLDPWVETHCQYRHWAGMRWKYRGSLFDRFVKVPKVAGDPPKLFVTLGTIRPYRFDALVDAVVATGLADNTTVWQLGTTHRDDLPGTVVSQFGASDFYECARAADVVITHAGVGTIMHLMEMGICPVVVPRRAQRSEHVDDHQGQIASLLHKREIATVCEVGELDAQLILDASVFAVETATAAG